MAEFLPVQRWPYVVAGVIALVIFFAAQVEVVDSRRPLGNADSIAALATRSDVNVIFILLDTLRADRLGSYGYERDTSPQLDLIASEGVRFARNLAQSSWTKCSMASMWTGLYPQRTGVTRFDALLSSEARMPAEIFRDAGFNTAGIWRNGWVSGYFGFDQGFDAYFNPRGKPPPASVQRKNPTMLSVGTDFDVATATEEYLRAYGHERFFLYLHMMDIHEYVYDEDSALFGTNFSDVYDNSIRRTDSVISLIRQHLHAEGLLDNTIIVIASDHGEAFGERGLEGHARAVYRETTEVPWLISFPFRLEPGVVVNARTRNIDIWPTLFDILALEIPEGLDGRSQLPAILATLADDESIEAEERAIAHLDTTWGRRDAAPSPTVAIAQGPIRYVVSPGRGSGPVEHLYDAREDPGELVNVLGQHPELGLELREEALAYLKAEPPWQPEEALELDELQLNQLRALGYSLP